MPGRSSGHSCSSSRRRPRSRAEWSSNAAPCTPVAAASATRPSSTCRGASPVGAGSPSTALSALRATAASCSFGLGLAPDWRPRSTTRKPRWAYLSRRASVRHSPRTVYFSGRATLKRWRRASRARGVASRSLPSKPMAVQSMSVVKRRCAGLTYGARTTWTLGSGLPAELLMQQVMVCAVRTTVAEGTEPKADGGITRSTNPLKRSVPSHLFTRFRFDSSFCIALVSFGTPLTLEIRSPCFTRHSGRDSSFHFATAPCGRMLVTTRQE
mmetsp:Transcript_111541/g.315473  ORF Transcript_111541/g.315473 Transcript_111541/m.315473 type:complete len:269 (+) Transcript_111541:601-1407(+)